MPSLSNDNQYFNKQVLFAPALELSYKQYLLMLLQFLPNSFLVPSVHMPEYRFHEGTTLGAYRACIEASKNFKKLSSKKALNIPTLVFLNPNDELINYKNTVSLLKSHDLRSWSIELVSNSQSSHSKPRAHMMIDSTCLGDAEWKKVQNKIKNHFLL